MSTALGQFIDHDITAQTDRPSMVSDIRKPAVIPQDPDHIVCNLKNLRRAFLELDSVYGDGRSFDPSCPTQAEARGMFDGAKMQIGQNTVNSDIPGALIPPEDDLRRDLPRNSADRSPIIGDGRNDENLIVAQLHTAFLRFHNAIVDVLASGGAGLSDEGLFNEASRLVRWHYQWIVLNEYLPTIAKSSVIHDIRKNGRRFFKPKVGIFMPLEFSVAAFRFGHSMVRGSYDFNRNFGVGVEAEPVVEDADFQQIFHFTGRGGFDPSGQGGSDGGLVTLPFNWIIEWDRFVAVNGNLRRSARKIDTRLAADLGNMQNQIRGIPADTPATIRDLLVHLAMRNLLRGYSLSIPTGQALAQAMGITPLTAAELKQDNSTELNCILDESGFIERTPAWYYILKESEVRECGNSLGDVGSRIVGETLIGLIEEDPDSFMNATNHWKPEDGVGVMTIEELFRFSEVLP
ncbi:peroxidase family protein [Candidatus Entotheonella palauensis]|uniref:peroxidase family protein n=1 Tax=Candidatus Entotheonella palauensis TaxID=93172 RepID=UPI000B7EDA78|nr:heme peroxidase family protein [Candidatus Entotheonella palauensis]